MGILCVCMGVGADIIQPTTEKLPRSLWGGLIYWQEVQEREMGDNILVRR